MNYESRKGISTKHTSRCLRKAYDDEPIFVLRAKDITSPSIIKQWVAQNIGTQPLEKLKIALELAIEMEQWRDENEVTFPERDGVLG